LAAASLVASFQGEMHAFVAAILLRMAKLDALNANAEAKPPDGKFAEVQQRSKGRRFKFASRTMNATAATSGVLPFGTEQGQTTRSKPQLFRWLKRNEMAKVPCDLEGRTGWIRLQMCFQLVKFRVRSEPIKTGISYFWLIVWFSVFQPCKGSIFLA
jgi:hypothetical protein